MMIAASGTLAAIGQAFLGKQSKLMAKFRASLGGEGDAASAGDSGQMSELRRRIRTMGVTEKGAA